MNTTPDTKTNEEDANHGNFVDAEDQTTHNDLSIFDEFDDLDPHGGFSIEDDKDILSTSLANDADNIILTTSPSDSLDDAQKTQIDDINEAVKNAEKAIGSSSPEKSFLQSKQGKIALGAGGAAIVAVIVGAAYTSFFSEPSHQISAPQQKHIISQEDVGTIAPSDPINVETQNKPIEPLHKLNSVSAPITKVIPIAPTDQITSTPTTTNVTNAATTETTNKEANPIDNEFGPPDTFTTEGGSKDRAFTSENQGRGDKSEGQSTAGGESKESLDDITTKSVSDPVLDPAMYVKHDDLNAMIADLKASQSDMLLKTTVSFTQQVTTLQDTMRLLGQNISDQASELSKLEDSLSSINEELGKIKDAQTLLTNAKEITSTDGRTRLKGYQTLRSTDDHSMVVAKTPGGDVKVYFEGESVVVDDKKFLVSGIINDGKTVLVGDLYYIDEVLESVSNDEKTEEKPLVIVDSSGVVAEGNILKNWTLSAVFDKRYLVLSPSGEFLTVENNEAIPEIGVVAGINKDGDLSVGEYVIPKSHR